MGKKILPSYVTMKRFSMSQRNTTIHSIHRYILFGVCMYIYAWNGVPPLNENPTMLFLFYSLCLSLILSLIWLTATERCFKTFYWSRQNLFLLQIRNFPFQGLRILEGEGRCSIFCKQKLIYSHKTQGLRRLEISCKNVLSSSCIPKT